MATITRRFFETTSAANMASIDSLEAAYSAKCKTEAEASKIQNAVEYGRRVATAIFSWAATDGGHQAYSRIIDPTYIAHQWKKVCGGMPVFNKLLHSTRPLVVANMYLYSQPKSNHFFYLNALQVSIIMPV